MTSGLIEAGGQILWTTSRSGFAYTCTTHTYTRLTRQSVTKIYTRCACALSDTYFKIYHKVYASSNKPRHIAWLIEQSSLASVQKLRKQCIMCTVFFSHVSIHRYMGTYNRTGELIEEKVRKVPHSRLEWLRGCVFTCF